MPILPLQDSRIVYGSDDGGKSIHNSDQTFCAYMKQAADALQLAEHNVHGTRLCTGGDVEGHVVKEGGMDRYYLLDLARWAPPEDPTVTSHLPRVHSSIFYRMLRYEFLVREVKGSGMPKLSSDSLSGWGRKQNRQHGQNLRLATVHMCEKTVRKAVTRIMEAARRFSFTELPSDVDDDMVLKFPDTLDVASVLHRVGLPIRHLMLVWRQDKESYLSDLPEVKGKNIDDNVMVSAANVRGSLLALVQSRIQAEMISRCLKHQLKKLLRNCGTSRLHVDITKLLNCVMGDVGKDRRAGQFWRLTLPRDLFESFGMTRYLINESEWQVIAKTTASHPLSNSKDDSKGEYSVYDCVPSEKVLAVLRRIKFKQDGREEFSEEWRQEQMRTGAVILKEAMYGDSLWNRIWYMAFEDIQMSYFESIISGFRLAPTLLDPENYVEYINKLWQDLDVSVKGKGQPQKIKDAARMRSWQARLNRFSNPARFDWAGAYLRGCRRTIGGWDREFRPKAWGNDRKEAKKNPGSLAQIITRRHLRLVLREATEAVGVNLSQHVWAILLKWSVTSTTTPRRILSNAIHKGFRLLSLRCKEMDIVEWSSLRALIREANDTLDRFEEGSDVPGAGLWFKLKYTLRKANTTARRLFRSGGAGKFSDRGIAVLNILGSFHNIPWVQAVDASHLELLVRLGNLVHSSSKHPSNTNDEVKGSSFEGTTIAAIVSFSKRVWGKILRERLVYKHPPQLAITTVPAYMWDMKFVTVLDLSSNKLKNLPSEIGSLLALKDLRLSRNAIRSLPAQIGQLTNLEMVTLSHNSLRSLPQNIGHLRNLKQLLCDTNCLVSIPDEIENLASIERLNLRSNSLISLPRTFKNINTLVDLDLSDNPFYQRERTKKPKDLSDIVYHGSSVVFGEEVSRFGMLCTLRMSSCGIAFLSGSIGEITKLEKLEIQKNLMTSLPVQIGKLKFLTFLDLSRNQLKLLPIEIKYLKSLKRLNVASNRLESLPPDLGSSLEILRINGNRLVSLPSKIGLLKALQLLDGQSNKLTSLPTELGTLSKLSHLELSLNQITSLPETIGKLEALERLMLRGNLLKDIPAPIGEIKTLKYLDVRENELKGLPLQIESLQAGVLKQSIQSYVRNSGGVAWDLGRKKQNRSIMMNASSIKSFIATLRSAGKSKPQERKANEGKQENPRPELKRGKLKVNRAFFDRSFVNRQGVCTSSWWS